VKRTIDITYNGESYTTVFVLYVRPDLTVRGEGWSHDAAESLDRARTHAYQAEQAYNGMIYNADRTTI
jgi:hypothetical protein